MLGRQVPDGLRNIHESLPHGPVEVGVRRTGPGLKSNPIVREVASDGQELGSVELIRHGLHHAGYRDVHHRVGADTPDFEHWGPFRAICNYMNIPDALAALRTLDGLPEPRRKRLCALAATAPTDADRARIVIMGKRENIDQRWATEQALKAELDDRRAWATRNPEKPVEAPQKASKRMERTDETTPVHRPVIVTWGPVTKTAKVRTTRPEGIGTNRVYDDDLKPEPTRFATRTHGIVATYNSGCRCGDCSEASARRGREYRARRKQANSAQSPE